MFLDLDLKNKSAIAVIDDSGNEISYGGLLKFSSDFYAPISNRTLIFILSENTIGSLAGYVASMSNKIVPLLINCEMGIDNVNNLIKTYRPEYLWLPSRFDNKFRYEKVFEKYDFVLLKTALKPFALNENLSLLLSTSGSTGSPKLVRHSYSNVNESAKSVATFFKLTTQERAIAILPMQYTMGLSVVNSHLFAGATVLLSKANLTDKNFWNYMKDNKATSFTGVPFSFEILYRLRFFRMDLPDLKIISQGGGKLSKKLFKEYAEFAKRTNRKFIATYGQTEGTARMAYLSADKALFKIGSIGKGIPGGKLYLIDENGVKFNDFEKEGELVYEGANVTMGYAVCGDDLIMGDLNNGVLRTGDVAVKDSEGYFYIVGRTNRFLKLYGVRVSLDELQELISTKFKTDCICSGNDEKMRVYITREEIKENVKNYIVDTTRLFHKAFEVCYIEEIPRNAIGKIIYSPN